MKELRRLKIFNLRTKVVCKGDSGRGEIAGKGVIVGLYLNGDDTIKYQVKLEGQHNIISYIESSLKPIKIKVLHAYLDQTDEVHWATKQYSDKELKEFGFTNAPEYNKEIELDQLDFFGILWYNGLLF